MTYNVINRKWATMKDEKLKMQLNGFVMNTSVDKIDELFDEGIIRYVVNHQLFELDMERQIFFEEGDKRVPISKANTATIGEHKVYCEVVLQVEEYPGFCQKNVRGTAWDWHQKANKTMDEINEHKYYIDPDKGELSMLEIRRTDEEIEQDRKKQTNS